MPWATRADLMFDAAELTAAGGTLWRCESVRIDGEFTVLGHERAARIEFTRGDALVVSQRVTALADLALAAYLVGAGRRVMTDVVRYVHARTQFRKTLSQFQAVAHPLAECDTRIAAAVGTGTPGGEPSGRLSGPSASWTPGWRWRRRPGHHVRRCTRRIRPTAASATRRRVRCPGSAPGSGSSAPKRTPGGVRVRWTMC